ncbi:MAG: hydroxyquinol 1,2-dioxygenase [Chitinophagaceae bacterium]|nr:hydroxyquinol 1,2-dioxygenase [Rubrivivax sp.]
MDPISITPAVIAAYRFSDPRTEQLMHGLIDHLHNWAREVGLTHAEWRAGLRFLSEAAAITDASRNEFSLLSDVLGLSSLVDLLRSAPGATPSSVLGPFHAHDSQPASLGADLAGAQAGEPTLLVGRVLAVSGEPLAAEIDFWQNADNGLYPAQDPSQDPHNLRCKLATDSEGHFHLRTLRPRPYSVPHDGPVGAMLRAAGRHSMRPAHFHLIVSAPGYEPVVTELFPDDDAYLAQDAAFGVRPALAVKFERCDDPQEAARAQMPVPFARVSYTFRLAPERG